MFIKFYDTALKEELSIDVKEIVSIEKGRDCIIIENKDEFLFETEKIRFVE